MMSGLILKNATLADGQRCNIIIKDNLIKDIVPAEQQCGQEQYQVLDAEGMMALPGFINMHCHSAMTLMRGAQEDDFLKGWLDKIWKMENNLTPDVVYAGTRLACLEMIKSRTTCFFDQYRIFKAF